MGNNVHKRAARRLHRICVLSACSLFSQGFLADAEDGYAAYHFKVHAVTQVVAHIGHAVEMYQVVLAIVDDRHDLFAQCRGQAAVKLVHLVLCQVVNGLLRFSQIGTAGGELGIGGGVEVAQYPVAGSGIGGHFMVQLGYIFGASQIEDRTEIPSMASV